MITPTLRASLARKIRDARLAAKMQQQDLADRVGLTRTSISNIEHGKQGISVDMLYCIAQQLGVSADVILRDAISTTERKMNPELFLEVQAAAVPDTAFENVYNLIKEAENEE